MKSSKAQMIKVSIAIKKNKKGFSLLETLLVVGLLSLIVVSIAPFFKTTVDGWQVKDRQLELLQISRVGMDKMIKELKTAVEFTKANPSEVEFLDWDNQEVEYQLDGSILEREGQSLVESVDSLIFTYYDVEGNQTIDADEVYSLEIAMTVLDSENKVKPLGFTSRVVMRRDPIISITYQLAINEINDNPAKFKKGNKKVPERSVEWVEVYNYGDSPIDLDGWTIEDTRDSDNILKQGSTSIINAGGYGLIAAKYNVVDTYYSVGSSAIRFKLNDNKIGNALGNNGDTITIKDADGNIVDSVRYYKWASRGQSMERESTDIDSNQASNWQASNLKGTYTPGKVNTVK